MTTGAVEKLDDHTVRLHLNRPVLAIPENLYHYPCAIVHRRFDDMGADLSKHPIGTGAYTLKNFVVGEKCVLIKRPARDYWGPEVYLDTITYIDHGDDPAAHLAALASKQVDMVHEVGVESLPGVERLPHVVLQEVVTAQTGVARRPCNSVWTSAACWSWRIVTRAHLPSTTTWPRANPTTLRSPHRSKITPVLGNF